MNKEILKKKLAIKRLDHVYCRIQPSIINGVGLQKLWMDTGINLGLPAKFVSLDWAVFYTVVIYFIVYQLYKKKIFIKI